MKECLICATALIAALVLLRPVLRRVSARMRYALWLLVLLRLALPVPLMDSPISVMNFLYTQAAPAAPTAPSAPATPSFSTAPTVSTAPSAPAAPAAPAAPGPAAFPWRQLWVAGSAAMGLWFLAGNWRFARQLRRSRQPLDAASPLSVYVVPGLSTPCLFGLLRPAIYVTPEVAAEPEWLRYAIDHEATHHRHGDLWWSAARGLCLSVYWFHPLVWVAAVLSRRDGELACDESVLRGCDAAGRIAYGRTLLGLVSLRANPGQLLRAGTSMASGKRELTARIRAIAKQRRTAAGALAAALVLLTIAVGCTFTGAQGDKPRIYSEPPEVTATCNGVTFTLRAYGVSWHSPKNSYVADALHPLQYDEALWAGQTVTLTEPTTLTVAFEVRPTKMTITTYDAGAAFGDAPIGTGDMPAPSSEDEETNQSNLYVEPGTIKVLHVTWAGEKWGGDATYALRLLDGSEPTGDADIATGGADAPADTLVNIPADNDPEPEQRPPVPALPEDPSDIPVLGLVCDGEQCYPLLRPEIWDGIAWDTLSPTQWAEAEDAPALQTGGEVQYWLQAEPIELRLAYWNAGDTDLTYGEPWDGEQHSNMTLPEGYEFFLLTARFPLGSVQYLFRIAAPNAAGHGDGDMCSYPLASDMP